MLAVDIGFAPDQYRPLGSIVGQLTTELWLCELSRRGIGYTRIDDSQILISERDYTVVCLCCLDPELNLTCTHVV